MRIVQDQQRVPEVRGVAVRHEAQAEQVGALDDGDLPPFGLAGLPAFDGHFLPLSFALQHPQ